MGRLIGIVGLALVVLAGSGCAVGVRGAVTQITTDAAVLNGGVASTSGGPVTYYFEYGQGDGLQKTPGQTLDLGTTHTRPVSAPVTGLDPQGSYRFRVCAEDSENPGDPFCSPFRNFSTAEAAGQDYVVGQFMNSGVLFVVDARSDPSGAHPDGQVTASEGRLGSETADVACLRVNGNRATIGLRFPSAGDGFFFFEDNPTGEDRFASVPLEAGQSVADCPAVPSTLGAILNGDVSVHDVSPSP